MWKIVSYDVRQTVGESVVYLWPEDEAVHEQIENRTRRPVEVWKGLAESVLADAGIAYDEIEWDQYAGCICPCSPGFVLYGTPGLTVQVHVVEEGVA